MSGSSKTYIDLKIKIRKIMIFGKSNESDSQQVKQIFEQYYLPKGKFNQIRQIL
jgi:hypothetical protein